MGRDSRRPLIAELLSGVTIMTHASVESSELMKALQVLMHYVSGARQSERDANLACCNEDVTLHSLPQHRHFHYSKQNLLNLHLHH